MCLPLNQSIQQVGPAHWQIGSLICERIETTPPPDSLATWQEHDCRYIIRRPEDARNTTSSFATYSNASQLIHEGGSLSAVWEIGKQAFCKVKAWNPAMESEDKTIAYVKEIAPGIPTPKLIYAWTDRDRSFLVMKRIEGSTLRDAWASLSLSERGAIVTTVGHYCNILSQHTSRTLGSISGKPLLEPYLAPSGSDLLGQYTREQCTRYFSTSSGDCPKLKRVFNFYHPDLGPGNIIVSEGRIAGIIDWEAAGYYPRFWIATKPSVSPGLDFCPPIAEVDDCEWRKRLRIELEVLGYPQASRWYMKWRMCRPKT